MIPATLLAKYCMSCGTTFISLQTLFKTVTILLSVSILLTLVLTTFDFYNPEFVYLENPTEEEEVVLLTIGLVGILNAIISVAGGIFFLWWFYRAYKNLKTLGIALKSTPRRVIVNFFIPIINFWKPYFAQWKYGTRAIRLLYSQQNKKVAPHKVQLL